MTDTAHAASAGAAAASQQGASGSGFLAMLDGLIQNSAGSQTASNSPDHSSLSANSSPDEANAAVVDADQVAADKNAATAQNQDDAVSAAEASAQIAAAQSVTPVLPNAITFAPIVAGASAKQATKANAVPDSNGDAALVLLANQGASVQASANTSSLAAGAVTSSLSQAVSDVQASETESANANTAQKKTDQQNSDTQQSAILSALFAHAPLVEAATPILSTGVTRAGPSSVPGGGNTPPLSPAATAGNGTTLAALQALPVQSLASDDTDDAAPASASHAAPGVAFFGIGNGSDPSVSDASANANSNNAEGGTAFSASPSVPDLTVDPAKGQAIASLFVLPQEGGGKTAAQTALTATDDKGVANVTPVSGDTSALGLTLTHQTSGLSASASPAATATASYAAANTPADQVSLVLQRAVNSGTQSMTIALNPVELGKVEVKLNFAKDGTVQASVTADRPETLTMLKNDHSMLTQALNNAGLSTNSNSLSFNLRDGANSSQQGFANASSYRNPAAATADAANTTDTPTTTVQYAVTSATGRLNLFV